MRREIVSRWFRRGGRDLLASPLGLYRVLGALISAGLIYVLAQILGLANAMTGQVFLLALLACAVWFGIDVLLNAQNGQSRVSSAHDSRGISCR